jgi:hypothetical protein
MKAKWLPVLIFLVMLVIALSGCDLAGGYVVTFNNTGYYSSSAIDVELFWGTQIGLGHIATVPAHATNYRVHVPDGAQPVYISLHAPGHAIGMYEITGRVTIDI